MEQAPWEKDENTHWSKKHSYLKRSSAYRSQLQICPMCKKEIAIDAAKCPYCHSTTSSLLVAIIIGVLLFISYMAFRMLFSDGPGFWEYPLAFFVAMGIGVAIHPLISPHTVKIAPPRTEARTHIKNEGTEMTQNRDSSFNQTITIAQKQCPMCAEYVKTEAKICRFCRHVFNETQ